jgi:short-subunit dehydrogenase
VNCAGFSTVGELHSLDPERERAQLRTNAEAIHDLTCALLPGMVERGRGAILNVASMGGFQPIPRWATYSASKAFAITFSEALAAEVKAIGITVTVLCPGPVKTEFTQVSGIEAAEEGTPGFLWAEPDEIARAGLRGLERGKRVVIPRTLPKVVSWIGRHSPRRLSLAVLRRVWLSGEEAG